MRESSRKATRICPSSGPRMNRMRLLTEKSGDTCTAKTIEMATFSAPASSWITWSDLAQIWRVISKLEPGGARKRTTNSPESTCGKSSLPSCGPRTASSAALRTKYAGTTTRRHSTSQPTTLPNLACTFANEGTRDQRREPRRDGEQIPITKLQNPNKFKKSIINFQTIDLPV